MSKTATVRKATPGTAPSERELQVLTLAAQGYSDKQIARRLHLTEATIKTHLQRIYTRLRVDGGPGARIRAVVKAHRVRLINLDKEQL